MDRLSRSPAAWSLLRPSQRSREPIPRSVRLGVKALFTRGDRVLVIKERRVDGSTFWTLPGGGLLPEESPTRGLKREVDEELSCGIVVDASVALCTYHHVTRPQTVTVYSVLAGTLVGKPTPNRDEGIVSYRWVNVDGPPATTLAPFRDVIAGYDPQNRDSREDTSPSPPNHRFSVPQTVDSS